MSVVFIKYSFGYFWPWKQWSRPRWSLVSFLEEAEKKENLEWIQVRIQTRTPSSLSLKILKIIRNPKTPLIFNEFSLKNSAKCKKLCPVIVIFDRNDHFLCQFITHFLSKIPISEQKRTSHLFEVTDTTMLTVRWKGIQWHSISSFDDSNFGDNIKVSTFRINT